ncbi:hypothetical protein [Paenibacillus sp. R14(2021)]|uniref:hypothetical protein n=1 Tax=Paenibacillus sp. R14(2021) TaxID=2859228 RepID=UPI001C6119A0|nr:hypothetical protein [Paenibacillus sp. R14(2021)]
MRTHILRKQLAVLGTAAALLLAGMPVHAMATAPSTEQQLPSSEQMQAQHEQERDHWRWSGHGHGHNREERQARKLEHMKEAAQYFGIASEGKSAEQLHKELKEARKANPAKWEKFKAEKQAQRLARLQETAKRLGIATEGKSARQLHKEIQDACKNRMIKQREGNPSSGAESKTYDGKR